LLVHVKQNLTIVFSSSSSLFEQECQKKRTKKTVFFLLSPLLQLFFSLDETTEKLIIKFYVGMFFFYLFPFEIWSYQLFSNCRSSFHPWHSSFFFL